MAQFTAKTFKVPKLQGISEKTIEEHLKLYQGYVTNANAVLAKIEELRADADKNAYLLGELGRHFSFEFNGIRNHEVYFSSLEGGSKEIPDGDLKKMITETWGSFDTWLAAFKHMAATTRGIGWAVLWYDPSSKQLLMSWVDEQHLGQLNNCNMILGLDMWEHSYVADYQPSGKKKYIEDFFANLNWTVIEENLKRAQA